MKCEGITSTTLISRRCKNIIKKGKFCRHHLPKFEKPKECPICMQNMFQTKYPLECGHWVHKSCLRSYAKNKFENEITRFHEGYMPSLKIECPICKHTLKNDIVDHPYISLHISRDAIIEAIRMFYRGIALEKSLFVYLTSLQEIYDEELIVIFFEIAYILRCMIICDLEDEKTIELLKTIIPETIQDTTISPDRSINLDPEERKIYSRYKNVIYSLLNSHERSELLFMYQL